MFTGEIMKHFILIVISLFFSTSAFCTDPKEVCGADFNQNDIEQVIDCVGEVVDCDKVTISTLQHLKSNVNKSKKDPETILGLKSIIDSHIEDCE